jgi:hypothetical protein
MEENPRQHRFTLVFDREAYSPELFAEMQSQRIVVLTYHKYPGEDWPQTASLGCGILKSCRRADYASDGRWGFRSLLVT